MIRSRAIVGLGSVLVACTPAPDEPDHRPSWSDPSEAAVDRIRYSLTFGSESYVLDAFGAGSPNLNEDPSCVSSFNHDFFRGWGDHHREPNSLVEVIVPDYTPGASSLVPPIDEPIESSWRPPQWRVDDDRILGVFGGTVTLERYDPDAVVLVFEDTEVCTLAIWGFVDPIQYRQYTEQGLATDCAVTPEVKLEAFADPTGSFERTDDPEVIHAVTSPSPWRTLDGQPLCR